MVEDHQPLIGDAVFTDGPGLLIVVEKLPGANALEVTDKLDSAVDSLRPGLSDVEIDTSFFRPASYIDQSDDNLRFALILGIVLLVLVLGALLFDLRRVAVTLASILVSMAAAVLVLRPARRDDQRHGAGRVGAGPRDHHRRRRLERAGCRFGEVHARVPRSVGLRDGDRPARPRADARAPRRDGRVPAAAGPVLRRRGGRLDAGRAHVHPRPGRTRPQGRPQSVPGHRTARPALPSASCHGSAGPRSRPPSRSSCSSGWGSRWLPCSTRTDPSSPTSRTGTSWCAWTPRPAPRFRRCAGSRPEREPSSAHCPA